MYDIIKNEITFPHIIPGAILGNKLHTINSINGGMKRIYDAPFCLMRNQFFGGITEKLGLITEYGFYACLHYERVGTVVGFYIHDPSMITDEGKRIIEEKYPGAKIVYEKQDVVVKTELSPEEKKRKEQLLIKAAEMKVPAYQIGSESVDELESVLECIASGKSGKTASVEHATVSNDINVPVSIKRGRPSLNA